jgi:outer membrane protein assembly factor BamB
MNSRSALACAAALVTVLNASAAHWPAWRGPTGDGRCEETGLPLTWSRTEKVRWRVPLPEPGNSTPVIWADRVFVTQAQGERRLLLCLRRTDGQRLWEAGVTTSEHEPTHETNPFCSASPVTDGERVVVSFASDGLYCYDLEGKEIWRRTDLGRQIHIWGGGVSPSLRGDLCFLNFGPGETTYLLAVDKRTGATVWKAEEQTGYGMPAGSDVQGGPRDRATFIGSWSTPVFLRVEGTDQLLMSWPRRLAAYDPVSGRELWTCGGLNPLCYTSPIFEEGVVVAMGGFNGATVAVRPGGSGDITGTGRIWRHARTKQRIGSGVVHNGYVYVHNDPGVAECFDLKTGALVWEERLKGPGASGQNWSSAMLAGGHCYTINQSGDCFVFKASPKFELVAVNSLEEPSNSSIAPAFGQLFIRTHRALWCIDEL